MYHESSTLFVLDVPGTFFNATHQVKAIVIGVSEANPLAEIDWFLQCVHLHVFYLFPHTHLWLSILNFKI